MKKPTYRFKLKNVVIRWYAPEHRPHANRKRPGEIDILPWCENFRTTHLCQRGGFGGFYAYRETKGVGPEPYTPRAWLTDVYWQLIKDGIDEATITAALQDLEGFHWLPQKGGRA